MKNGGIEHTNLRRDRYCSAFALVGLLIFLVYSNTLSTEWHFDDYTSILENPNVHMDHISIETIKKSFFNFDHETQRSEAKIFRPVSNLSFALNWHAGGSRSVGYHLVNIAIHVLTAFFLYLSIDSLFQTPKIKPVIRTVDGHFIALLSTVLWAVNPIQIQAVTYIVQRMAALAAFFSILGIFLFLKGRLSSSWTKRAGCFTGCAIALLLAVGSKENAVVTPICLLLLEVAFFKSADSSIVGGRRGLMILLATAGCALLILFLMVFSTDPLREIFIEYENRPFSMTERLMTQMRVLVFYLSLVYYPAPARFSLLHDIPISVSLIDPWTTAICTLIILLLIVFGFRLLRKKPLYGFPILFFFCGHLIESTILPLELIFEHRNYLPSLFLFLPVAVVFDRMIRGYRHRRAMKSLLIGFVIALIFNFGWATHIRNKVWQTEKQLWEDTVVKAPKSSLAYHNLGMAAYRNGDVKLAMAYYQHALSIEGTLHVASHHKTLVNIAEIFLRQENYAQGEKACRKALKYKPGDRVAGKLLIYHLLKSGKTKEAENEADLLLKIDPLDPAHPYLKGLCLLYQDRYREASVFFENSLRLKPDQPDVLIAVGLSYSMTGNYLKAGRSFRKSIKFGGNYLFATLALIHNHIAAEDDIKAREATLSLFHRTPIVTIKKAVKDLSEGKYLWPLSPKLLSGYLADHLHDLSLRISDIPSKNFTE